MVPKTVNKVALDFRSLLKLQKLLILLKLYFYNHNGAKNGLKIALDFRSPLKRQKLLILLKLHS